MGRVAKTTLGASLIDAINLTKELIRAPSVTPTDAGAMDIVEGALTRLGFACRRMQFGVIENLYARYGTSSPNLCFAGHTDVVPVGDAAAWTSGAFDAEVEGVRSAARGHEVGHRRFRGGLGQGHEAGQWTGSLSFLITGDEEGGHPRHQDAGWKPWTSRTRSSATAWWASPISSEDLRRA